MFGALLSCQNNISLRSKSCFPSLSQCLPKSQWMFFTGQEEMEQKESERRLVVRELVQHSGGLKLHRVESCTRSFDDGWYSAEVSYRHGKLGSAQESRVQSNGRESLGVDFRQARGEFEESGPRNKAPEMRAQTGAKCSWTLPCSPAQKHPTQYTGPALQDDSCVKLHQSDLHTGSGRI